VLAAVVFTGNAHVSDWAPALRMYRGLFLIFLMIFLLGINTYGWRSSGVNHVLIFELDPRDHLTYHELFEVGTCSHHHRVCGQGSHVHINH
jgi:hypothetical protein